MVGATRFRKISDKLYLEGDKIYKKYQITFKATWFNVFYSLMESDKPMTILQLANSIGFTHITVKNIVREMEVQKYVHIRPHPLDGRSKLVSLSRKGEDLIPTLERVWDEISLTLKETFDKGHPDFLNIIQRIEGSMEENPITELADAVVRLPELEIVDYDPNYKTAYLMMVREWILRDYRGYMEGEEKFSLNSPAEAYLLSGGFLFFALLEQKPIGCVALKKIDAGRYELSKLTVIEAEQGQGIGRRLLERCISRCKENNASELWIQTTDAMERANAMFEKLGFVEQSAPSGMIQLKRMQSIKCLQLDH